MTKTYGEEFAEALACETREEAAAWLKRRAREYAKTNGWTMERARDVVRSNIGYMAGYYGRKEQEKIFRLFNAPHPILGTPEEMYRGGPKQWFRAGVESVRNKRKRKPRGKKP